MSVRQADLTPTVGLRRPALAGHSYWAGFCSLGRSGLNQRPRTGNWNPGEQEVDPRILKPGTTETVQKNNRRLYLELYYMS